MNLTTKNEVLKRLFNSCEKCIISPENPFTMDNPDAIIAKDGHLYALFIPTYSERDNYDHIIRRLHLSQLSYALRFVTILMLDHDYEMKQHGLRVMQESFCHISTDIADVVAFVNRGDKINKRWEIINAYQQEHFLRYQLYTKLSQKYKGENHSRFLIEDGRSFPIFSTKSWYDESKEIRIKGVFDNQRGLIAYRKKGKVPNFISSFQKIMTVSFMREYVYDNGYIYSNKGYSDDKINVINTDWNLFYERDYPNEYNSMLAFAGLVPVTSSTQIDIENLYQTYQNLVDNVNRQ